MTTTLPAPAARAVEGMDGRALVARVQAGDVEAFGTLYARYAGEVSRVVRRRVSGDRALVEDLTADVFERALRRIHTFSWQGRDVGAWLVTIACNRVADYYKSARFQRERLFGEIDSGADVSGTPGSDPAAAAVAHLTNLTVMRALDRLAPQQRRCLLMRFVQDLSVGETAAALGISYGAAKNLQYWALRNLARVLAAEGCGPPGGRRVERDVARAVA